MANYLYNGVELPDINEVWTDKIEYPYAIILDDHKLYLSKTASFKIYADSWVISMVNREYYTLQQDNWNKVSDSSAELIIFISDNITWSNFDILNKDGSVYLAASDPVPVGNAIIPLAHYKAACDAIRAKTGKTEKIKSGDMATEIEEMQMGGGGEKVFTLLNATNEASEGDWVLSGQLPLVEGETYTVKTDSGTFQSVCKKAYDGGDLTGETYALYLGNVVTILPDFTVDATNDSYGYAEVYPKEGDNYQVGVDHNGGANIKIGQELPLEEAFLTGIVENYTNEKITRLREWAFAGQRGGDPYYGIGTSVSLPNVQDIPNACFYDNQNILSLDMPSAKSVGIWSFVGCLIKNIYLPNVETVGRQAFTELTETESIELPKAKTINADAFSRCYSMKRLILPSATNVTGEMLDSFGSLETLDISGLTEIESGSFSVEGLSYALKTVIAKNATKVGSSAFRGLPHLSVVDMPNVKSIGDNAFGNCGFTEITPENFPNVAVLGGTFNYCQKLKKVVLWESLEELSYEAFGACFALETVTFNGTPSTISADVFNNCTALTTINVPWAEGAVANAPWGATNATINYNYTGE